jgi:hypothetical protein
MDKYVVTKVTPCEIHPAGTEDFCLKCVLGEKRVDADLFEVLEEWWAEKMDGRDSDK